MRRCCCSAQSLYFRKWLYAVLTETLPNGLMQTPRLSAGVSMLKRRARERWLCTATMSHNGESTNGTGEMVEDMGLNSLFRATIASNVVGNDALGYRNKESCLSTETGSGADDSLVEAQSKVIRIILDDEVWGLHMQERLRSFVNILTPALVARVLNQVGSVKTAQSFFDWVVMQDGYKHNVFVYNALIIKLGVVKSFDAIEELLRKMRREKCTLTSTTFAIIIQSYGKAGLLEECWNTFVKAERIGIKPDARMYTSLLRVLFHAGKVAKAKQLIGRMEDEKVEFDLHTWFTIIQGLCKNKMMADAQKFFDRMLSTGCAPNPHVFNAIILGFCESGDLKKVLSFYEMMQKKDCKPDIYTYNTLIQAYCGLQKHAEAEVLVSDMQGAGCEPNRVTFNILLQHYSQKGHSKEAHALFSRMQEGGWVDHVSYRLYTSLLRRSGEVQKLFSLAESVYSRYGNTDSEVCNAILQFHCENGNLSEATKYLDETFVRVSAPNEFSFALMMNAYCTSGDVDSAHALLSTMVERGCMATTMHYDLVIMSLCKHSRASQAFQLFKEMNIKGVESNFKACERLLADLSDAGEVEEAIYVCKHIILKRHCVNGLSLVSFMKCLSNSDRTEDAKVLLKEMMHMGCFSSSRSFRCCLAHLLEGEIAQVEKYFHKQKPNVIDYTLKIKHACKIGMLDVAKATLAEMKELGVAPSPACYHKLIYRLSKCKDTVSESLDLLEEMLERGLGPGDALTSYLMDSFHSCEQQDVMMRFCRIVIAKRLTLRKGSASFLLQQEDESELKKLYLELTESGCLVETVPTYNPGKLNGEIFD